MQILLNEYTLAILCGGISYLTYLISNSLVSGTGKTVRIQEDDGPKTPKTILKSSTSETTESAEGDEDGHETDPDEQV